MTVFESKDKKPKIDTRVKKHYCFINGDLCANVLFFKLSKKCVTRDVLSGVMYIPPEGSPSENKDVFTELENSLLLLEHDGVCFLWDFNARTGAVDSIITDGFNKILTCRIKFLMMPLVVKKSRVHYRKYHRTWLLTITVLDCWIFAERLMLLLSRRQYWEMYM